MITAVAGLLGSGKTHWIREQIAQAKIPVSYFSPKTESVPIDAICLQTEFSDLKILSEEDGVVDALKEAIAYIEIPWYIDRSGIDPLLEELNCHRVAVIPSGWQNTPWHTWADEVIPGNNFEVEPDKMMKRELNEQIQISRIILTEEVVEFASLETFWHELIGGAYGTVIRVKGIFELQDGQSIYGEFVKNLPQKNFQAMNVPRWLDGRPQRFSGLEIIGQSIDKNTIIQTLQDFCLSDLAINHYQQQIQESLDRELDKVR